MYANRQLFLWDCFMFFHHNCHFYKQFLYVFFYSPGGWIPHQRAGGVSRTKHSPWEGSQRADQESKDRCTPTTFPWILPDTREVSFFIHSLFIKVKVHCLRSGIDTIFKQPVTFFFGIGHTPLEQSHLLFGSSIRIKSGEPGIPGFSVPGRLGGVICKPEGAAFGLVKTPPSLRARK